MSCPVSDRPIVPQPFGSRKVRRRLQCLGVKNLGFIMSLIVGLALLASPGGAAAGATIDFVSVVHDFGTVRQGELLEHVFEFANTGTEELLVKGLTPT